MQRTPSAARARRPVIPASSAAKTKPPTNTTDRPKHGENFFKKPTTADERPIKSTFGTFCQGFRFNLFIFILVQGKVPELKQGRFHGESEGANFAWGFLFWYGFCPCGLSQFQLTDFAPVCPVQRSRKPLLLFFYWICFAFRMKFSVYVYYLPVFMYAFNLVKIESQRVWLTRFDTVLHFSFMITVNRVNVLPLTSQSFLAEMHDGDSLEKAALNGGQMTLCVYSQFGKASSRFYSRETSQK